MTCVWTTLQVPSCLPAVAAEMSALLPRIDQLLAYFNRHVLDVPDGLIDRNTSYRLNGVPYEELLGRDGNDALVRLITRDTAGYRFAVQALLHALPDASITRLDFSSSSGSGTSTLAMRGILRGTAGQIDERIQLEFRTTVSETLDWVDVMVPEAVLERLRLARATA